MGAMRIPAGGRLAIAGVLLVAAACTGDGDSLAPARTTTPAAEVVPWSRALEAAARRGEYREVVAASNDPPRIVLTWQVTARVEAVPTIVPADVATRDECGPTA